MFVLNKKKIMNYVNIVAGILSNKKCRKEVVEIQNYCFKQVD